MGMPKVKAAMIRNIGAQAFRDEDYLDELGRQIAEENPMLYQVTEGNFNSMTEALRDAGCDDTGVAIANTSCRLALWMSYQAIKQQIISDELNDG